MFFENVLVYIFASHFLRSSFQVVVTLDQFFVSCVAAATVLIPHWLPTHRSRLLELQVAGGTCCASFSP